MYQADNLAALEDTSEKKVKKRKLHKHKKKVRNNDDNVSSDSETVNCKSPKCFDLKFSLSQTSQSFSEIFSQAQATLREHPSKTKLSKYNQSELPFIQWTSDEPNPKQLRKNHKKTKGAKIKHKNESLNEVVDAISNPRKNENITDAPQQFEMNSYHISVADLETDTELSDVPFETPNTNLATESNVEEIVIVSSSDEDSPIINQRYQRKNFRPSSTRRSIRRSCSPISVVTISSRSSSPLMENFPNSPLRINPPEENVEVAYQVGDMRIRILYRGDLHEFDGNEDWDVEKVREKLSELTNVPESELLIYTENEQKMEDGKTLKEYDIKLGEILEALRRCTENLIPQGEGVIKLKFQKEGLKRPLHLNVLKYRNLKEIRSQVAKLIQVDEKKLFFRIDGEVVDLLKTPDDLELENDFCVDIFEKN